MSTTPASTQPNLIDDIDARQNRVLDELDALNARVESVLKSCAPPSQEQEEAS